MTTTLAPRFESDRIRVNCIVPDWVATPEVKEYYDGLTPLERADPRIPPVLISLDEIAQAVVDLITDSALTGRVLVYWCGQEPALVAAADPGYGALEPYDSKWPPR